MADSKSYPKKYWWVVVVAVPIVIALIGVVPRLTGGSGDTRPPAGISVVGDGNTVIGSMTVVNNITVIAREVEKYTGQALSDDLKRLIEQALALTARNDAAASVKLYEQIASRAPVPAIFNNLGVAYAHTQNAAASEKAFTQAIEKDPSNQIARTNLEVAQKTLARAASKSVATVASGPGRAPSFPPGDGVTTRSGGPAIQVDAFDPAFAKVEGIHVVAAGAGSGGGSYSIKYQPEPNTPVLVDPGTYDVLVKTSGGGVFLLARNVTVKEGTLVHLNPNALVGAIDVRPLTRQGFPELKAIVVLDHATSNSRLIRQATSTPGVTLPIAPGVYDVAVKTDDGQADLVRNFEIKAREFKRLDIDNEVAAIVVREPNIKGLNVKAIYALRTGTNQIAGKSTTFGTPMLVYAGEAYDVALDQPAGLTRLKTKVMPSRGSVTEVR